MLVCASRHRASTVPTCAHAAASVVAATAGQAAASTYTRTTGGADDGSALFDWQDEE